MTSPEAPPSPPRRPGGRLRAIGWVSLALYAALGAGWYAWSRHADSQLELSRREVVAALGSDPTRLPETQFRTVAADIAGQFKAAKDLFLASNGSPTEIYFDPENTAVLGTDFDATEEAFRKAIPKLEKLLDEPTSAWPGSGDDAGTQDAANALSLFSDLSRTSLALAISRNDLPTATSRLGLAARLLAREDLSPPSAGYDLYNRTDVFDLLERHPGALAHGSRQDRQQFRDAVVAFLKLPEPSGANPAFEVAEALKPRPVPAALLAPLDASAAAFHLAATAAALKNVATPVFGRGQQDWVDRFYGAQGSDTPRSLAFTRAAKITAEAESRFAAAALAIALYQADTGRMPPSLSDPLLDRELMGLAGTSVVLVVAPDGRRLLFQGTGATTQPMPNYFPTTRTTRARWPARSAYRDIVPLP